jgi:DNA polymerase-4
MPAMQLPFNRAQPEIMHIDLNSCFATVEQQARPLLRNRPIGITNRKTTFSCIIAASYEAKALGVKVGMRSDEALRLAPGMVIVETDPPKYHYVYQRLMAIMRSYSPDVTMKSIDEGVIDFHGTRQHLNARPLADIGMEIKQRLKDDVGCWMKCNIGIAPNRFLAKQAASLHKPDGLDIINHANLRSTLSGLNLTDLSGIAERNQARLNAAGIYTPLQFLDASSETLHRLVFHSVCGDDWYQKLRGWEVDDHESQVRSVGRQYVLEDSHLSQEAVNARLAYLCESTGVRLRSKDLCARGILVYARYSSGDYWYNRKMFKTTFYSNAEIYRRAILVFNRRPVDSEVKEIGVTCYGLEPSLNNQMSLLDEVNKERWLSNTIDSINQQYGEFTLTFASSFSSRSIVKQKIPFGGTQYLALLSHS